MNLGISHRGRRIAFPLLLFLMVLIATPLFASGGRGTPAFDPRIELIRADALIDQGRLDEALALLVEIAQRDPEQMERVQDLVLEIRGVKGQINALFDDLKTVAGTGDEALADEKIRVIKSIDSDPNRNTLNNMILAAIIIGKARNDMIRDRIYEQGNARLAAGDMRGAVELYRSGFINDEYLEFHEEYISLAQDRTEISRYLDDPVRQEQIWEAYGTIAVEGNRVIEELQSTLDRWDSSAREAENVIQPLAESVASQDPGQWVDFIPGVAESLATALNDATDSGRFYSDLERLRVSLYAALDQLPEDFRYERIGEFMVGRKGNRGLEGVGVAHYRHWEMLYLDLAQGMEERIRSLIEDGRANYLARNHVESVESLNTALEAIRVAASFAVLAENYVIDTGENVGENFLVQVRNFTAYRAYAGLAVPVWLELNTLIDRLPQADQIEFTSLGVENIDAIAGPVQNIFDRVEIILDEWNEEENSLALLPGSEYSGSRAIDAAVREDLDRALELSANFRSLLYVNTVTLIYESLERRVKVAVDVNIEDFRRLTFGPEIAEDSEELPRRRPSDTANRLMTPALTDLQNAQSDIGDFLDVLDQILEQGSSISNPEELVAFAGRAEDLLLEVAKNQDALEELRGDALALVNAARRSETGAINALGIAARDLAAAQQAVGRGRNLGDIDDFYRAMTLYDAVDASLDIVDKAYLEVLVNDIDIAEASGIDASRNNLRDEVQGDRGRVAVTVKQNAVEEAQDSYEEGSYAFGIAVLSKSLEFWERVYGKDDPELLAWLTRLRNAQQALRQTVIQPTDPLYAEMNQYLNLANRYYTNGVRIAESNSQNSQVLIAFRAAEDLLVQVLNTFPGNEAALLLQQRILRQTDADTWASDARKLVNDTRRAVDIGDIEALRGTDLRKGLYAQVVVLQEIGADFPGIEGLIYDVEVALGVVIPPPDPAVLAESRRLTDEAGQLWTNLGVVGSERAVELLNRALVLWLENVDATQLKNQILLSTEPERLPALPPELLKLLNLVEQYYTEGNLIPARAFLDRINSEYSRFRNDPRIQNWNQKMEARL